MRCYVLLTGVVTLALVKAGLSPCGEPTIEKDLASLKGKWVSPPIKFKKGKSEVTVQLRLEFRTQTKGWFESDLNFDPPSPRGIINWKGRNPCKYEIVEEKGKRLLKLSGRAFSWPVGKDGKVIEFPHFLGKRKDEKLAEFPVSTSYHLKGDDLRIDAGTVRVFVPNFGSAVVSLKGVWERVTRGKVTLAVVGGGESRSLQAGKTLKYTIKVKREKRAREFSFRWNFVGGEGFARDRLPGLSVDIEGAAENLTSVLRPRTVPKERDEVHITVKSTPDTKPGKYEISIVYDDRPVSDYSIEWKGRLELRFEVKK